MAFKTFLTIWILYFSCVHSHDFMSNEKNDNGKRPWFPSLETNVNENQEIQSTKRPRVEEETFTEEEEAHLVLQELITISHKLRSLSQTTSFSAQQIQQIRHIGRDLLNFTSLSYQSIDSLNAGLLTFVPVDVIYEIFNFLDDESFYRLRQTSKKFVTLISPSVEEINHSGGLLRTYLPLFIRISSKSSQRDAKPHLEKLKSLPGFNSLDLRCTATGKEGIIKLYLEGLLNKGIEHLSISSSSKMDEASTILAQYPLKSLVTDHFLFEKADHMWNLFAKLDKLTNLIFETSHIDQKIQPSVQKKDARLLPNLKRVTLGLLAHPMIQFLENYSSLETLDIARFASPFHSPKDFLRICPHLLNLKNLIIKFMYKQEPEGLEFLKDARSLKKLQLYLWTPENSFIIENSFYYLGQLIYLHDLEIRISSTKSELIQILPVKSLINLKKLKHLKVLIMISSPDNKKNNPFLPTLKKIFEEEMILLQKELPKTIVQFNFIENA